MGLIKLPEESVVTDSKFYVYMYLDPRKLGNFTYFDSVIDYEPFYVGKGKDSRMFDRISEADSLESVSYLSNKIRKIRKDLGRDPIIVKMWELLSECSAFLKEKDLINFIGRKDLGKGPLLNLTDGGRDVVGYIATDEVLKRRGRSQSLAMKELYRLGKHPMQDPEVAKRIGITSSKTQLGRSLEQRHCQNISLSKRRSYSNKQDNLGIIRLPSESITHFKDNINDIFRSGNLAEGDWIRKTEELICNQNNSKYAVLCNSNGSGLFASLLILKSYYNRNLVLIQSNTFFGVKSTSLSAGFSVRDYVDCTYGTLMPSLVQVENKISLLSDDEKNRSVLILSHLGGIPNPEIKQISKLCKANNIILIEDGAHSYYSKVENGDFTCNFGDIGIFSFYSTKSIPTGEGGAIITGNKDIYDKLRKFIICDRFDKEMSVGLNIRVSEVQALFMYSVIRHSDLIVSSKMDTVNRYIDVLNKKGIDFVCPKSLGLLSNYYKFTVLPSMDQNKILYLKGRTSCIYDYYMDDLIKSKEKYPGTNKIIHGHMCLPTWPFQDQILTDKIIKQISNF